MRRSVIVLLACVSLGAPLHATTLIPLTFEQLVRGSALVVYGRVTAVEGRWTPDRRRIESAVTVDVLEDWKGRSRETVTLTVPGGQVGRYLNLIPGAPTFASGDLVVLFLTGQGARLPVPTGFTQGVYRVLRGPEGELLVMPPPISNGRVVRGARARTPIALSQFASSVRAVESR
jgi:hypothetical protein